jgi:hypothetical protein
MGRIGISTDPCYTAHMFRRLLMTLLIACLALPAMAAPLCHQPAPVAAAHEGHATHHENGDQENTDTDQLPSLALHGCIGCAVPHSARLIAVAPVSPDAMRVATRHHLPVGDHTVPDPPPPRG